jgi:hypothetical protein
MLKKALKKLSRATSRHREKESPPPARLLTAEGWKRLMMKKTRKS